jgi:competence protein ComEC
LVQKPAEIKSHFENQYLPGDKIIAEIQSLGKSSSSFQKCELEVKYLIRYKDTLQVTGKMLAFLEHKGEKYKRRDVLYTNASVDYITNTGNPGEFDAVSYWKNKHIQRSAFLSEGSFMKIGTGKKGLSDWFIDLQNYLSQKMDEALEPAQSGIAKALVLGDRSSLDSEVTRQFGNTGAMHVLAVSGLHVGILVQILTLLFSYFSRWISKNQAVVLALAFVWLYAGITGFSASVVRSALMFSVLSGSSLLGRNYISFNSLAFSALLLLMIDPYYLFDIGFQLSYLAMVGIFLFYPMLSKWFVIKNKWLKQAYDGTMIGIAAQLMTVPLTLYYFHQFPNYFMLSNIGLMVFSFVVLALGIAFIATHFIPYLSILIALLFGLSISLMLYFIAFIDQIPGAVALGFVLKPHIVIVLFALVLSLYYFYFKQHSIGFISTLCCGLLTIGFLIFNRFERMREAHVCFFNSKNPVVVVKNENRSYCFYTNRKPNKKQIAFLTEAYLKVYPSTITYFDISDKKSSTLAVSEKDSIQITRQKGGYQCQIFDKDYFLAVSNTYQQPKGKLILSPWLDHENTKNALRNGAIIDALK